MMLLFQIFRRLAGEITTGCHLHGQSLLWWFWVLMNLWPFWGTSFFSYLFFVDGSGISLVAVHMLNSVTWWFLSINFTSGALLVHDVFLLCYALILLVLLFPFARNPLYLGVIFVAFLLVKALWVQLDISGEFQNGAVSELHNFCFKISNLWHPTFSLFSYVSILTAAWDSIIIYQISPYRYEPPKKTGRGRPKAS